jgi:hypothetical protein
MSTPQGWQTPKTNWDSKDPVGVSDLNRMEGNPLAIETGDRTLDPAQAPSSNTGTLRQILSWFANRIKAIMGTTNWWDAPPVTLSGATPNTRKITAGHGLMGGGDLSADRILKINFGAYLYTEASDAIKYEALTERTARSSRLVKKFFINVVGTVRITYDLRTSTEDKTAALILRLNGSTVDPETLTGYTDKTKSLTYVSFSRDVDMLGPTVIEILIQGVGTTAYVRNVRVRYNTPVEVTQGVLLD